MGYLKPLNKAMGRALEQVHRIGGYRADYTVVADESTQATELLSGIYIQPTPLVVVEQMLGGRAREIMSDAGNLSAEALPIYLVSREALKNSSGVYRTPTHNDSFVQTGTTSPIFYVQQVTDTGAGIDGIVPGWFITTRTVFREFAPGE